MRLRNFTLAVVAAACTLLPASTRPAGGDEARATLGFSAGEVRRILSHGPWPPPWTADPSNRVSGAPAAAHFGKQLFFDPRLSRVGAISCATCHEPQRDFADGRMRAAAIDGVDRNTPGLLDVRYSRWFGWGGASDTLWGQSIRPILDPREMGASAAHIGTLVRDSDDLAEAYRRTFGRAPPADNELVLVDIGKALAAYQETLVSPPTPFDAFRDALARGDVTAAARYPDAARRGLKLFIGKGNCAVCHLGPRFTNGEFHDAGVPFLIDGKRVDPGRHQGIRRLRGSPYTLLGRFNDDPRRADGWATRQVVLQHRNWGEFRVPSLRGLVRTAPYMHAGSHATLADVVRHYSELDESRLHVHGERILRRLALTPREIADLVAFLESLSAPSRP